MRFTVVLASLALLIAGAASAAPSQSGLRGVVTRGPITPVCIAGVPCSEPAKNLTLVFSRANHIAGRAVTDGHGRYRIGLAAGFYSVRRAASAAVGKKLNPDRVQVFAHRFVRADFSIDTGIR